MVNASSNSSDPAEFAATIVEQLRERATAERRKVAEWYFPSAMDVLGVPVPAIRAVVRGQRKALRDLPPPAVIARSQALVDTNMMEARQVGYELIEHHAPTLDAITVPQLVQLADGMDNWTSVDVFCCSIAGRVWHRGRLKDSTIKKWARSKDRWWRRAALVSTVPLNLASRGGTGDPERTFSICKMLADDRDDMVAKALSWALRSVIEHAPGEVDAFLRAHDARITSRVRREVRKKLETGRKNG